MMPNLTKPEIAYLIQIIIIHRNTAEQFCNPAQYERIQHATDTLEMKLTEMEVSKKK